MALTPGRRLGAYEIVAPLGSGGMGHVYRARDTRLAREVAIKVVSDAWSQDPRALARLTREAHAVAGLNHPNIVTIFSIEEADDTRFITMELIEGRTLDKLIPGAGVPMHLFFQIAIAVSDALAAAHRRHVVHRDLKPANVMVSDEGRVKVLDFGLARPVESEHEQAEDAATQLPLTEKGIVLGTTPYMAPEQIEGKPLDPRTDVFSLGIVLYEMATGTRPFSGDSPPAVMASIFKDAPAGVVTRRRDFPPAVARLIEHCLEKLPRARIQTTAEVLNMLRAEQRVWESGSEQGRPLPAPPPVVSIAVLPFSDLSPARDQEWFCDGVAEDVLNALASLEGLKVTARTSSFSFKNTTADLRAIGQKLNAAMILEGSVRRIDDRVRITTQLSDAAEGFQVWSARYDRELKNIFDVQDDIARAIAERLKVTLASGRDERLVPQATADMQAYEAYLQACGLLHRRGANIPPAVELFRRAVELDPNDAAAWAGLADAYNVMAYLGVVRGTEARAVAVDAATRATGLDPHGAAGHAALACARLMYENDLIAARKEFELAIDLNPADVQSRCWYALLYLQWACGDFERGIAEARLAVERDPLSAYATMFLAACLYSAGRYDEAIESGTQAIERDAGSFAAHWVLGIGLGLAGRFDEAEARLEIAAGMTRHPSPALAILAVVYARSGKMSSAAAIHRDLTDRAADCYVPLAFSADGRGRGTP